MRRASCRLFAVALFVGLSLALGEVAAQAAGLPLPGGLLPIPAGPGATGGSTRDAAATEQTGPLRAPLTLTPFIAVVAEFNDNVLLNNQNRE